MHLENNRITHIMYALLFGAIMLNLELIELKLLLLAIVAVQFLYQWLRNQGSQVIDIELYKDGNIKKIKTIGIDDRRIIKIIDEGIHKRS